LGVIEEINQIILKLAPNGGRQLLELYKQVPGDLRRSRERIALDELRHLLIRVIESWNGCTTLLHDPGIHWTNNRTKQAIGKMKMGAESTRGLRTKTNMLNVRLVPRTNLT
jgi:hypothetical protein